jgi:hypothetical protein
MKKAKLKAPSKIYFRLGEEQRQQLEHFARANRISTSELLRNAVDYYIRRDDNWSTVQRTLNKLDRSQEVFSRDLGIAIESVVAFVWLYLAHTPEIPPTERSAVQRNSKERLSRWMQEVGRRINAGEPFVDLLAHDRFRPPKHIPDDASESETVP